MKTKRVPLSEIITVRGRPTKFLTVRAPSVKKLLAIQALDDDVALHFSFIAAVTGLSFLDASLIPLADHEKITAAVREVA